ncbi:MAG TPA: rhomboid family intramembrane serine protease, partial [Pseudomonadales bacterium]
YPHVRVNLLIVLGFYVTTVAVPAIYMLGYWFLLQVIGGLPQIGGAEAGGVAFWAHVGGFLAGVVLVFVFRRPGHGGPPGPRVSRARVRQRSDERWF